jgi:hypothetical protein
MNIHKNARVARQTPSHREPLRNDQLDGRPSRLLEKRNEAVPDFDERGGAEGHLLLGPGRGLPRIRGAFNRKRGAPCPFPMRHGAPR